MTTPHRSRRARRRGRARRVAARRRRRRTGRPSRSPTSCRSRRAAPPTSSAAPSARTGAGARSSRSSSRTSRAPAGGVGAEPRREGEARRLHAPRRHDQHARDQRGLYKDLPYDPVKDFEPITLVGFIPNALYVESRTSPSSTVQELIALPQGKDEKRTFASSGSGTSTHLAGELFADIIGVKLDAHPVQGHAAGDAGRRRRPGHVHVRPAHRGPAARQGGQAARCSRSRRRSARRCRRTRRRWPKRACRASRWSSWQAVYAPKGTPKPIVDRLNAEIVKVLKAPEVRQKMQDTMGIEVVASSPEELTKLMQSEIPRWAALVKKSGATAQLDQSEEQSWNFPTNDRRNALARSARATLCTQLFKRGFRNVYIQGIERLTQAVAAATSSARRSRCAASRRARTWTRSARSTIRTIRSARRSRACRPATCSCSTAAGEARRVGRRDPHHAPQGARRRGPRVRRSRARQRRRSRRWISRSTARAAARRSTSSITTRSTRTSRSAAAASPCIPATSSSATTKAWS